MSFPDGKFTRNKYLQRTYVGKHIRVASTMIDRQEKALKIHKRNKLMNLNVDEAVEKLLEVIQ